MSNKNIDLLSLPSKFENSIDLATQLADLQSGEVPRPALALEAALQIKWLWKLACQQDAEIKRLNELLMESDKISK